MTGISWIKYYEDDGDGAALITLRMLFDRFGKIVMDNRLPLLVIHLFPVWVGVKSTYWFVVGWFNY